MPIEHDKSEEKTEGKSSNERGATEALLADAQAPIPAMKPEAGNNSSGESKLENVAKLGSESEFTKEHFQSKQPVEIGGVLHTYDEGKGYVTKDPALNRLNPPGAETLNLGKTIPWGSPGPFVFAQRVEVSEGAESRTTFKVLPIPAFNDPQHWNQEVIPNNSGTATYRDFPEDAKIEANPRQIEKAGSIPSDAINLTKGYPSDLGGLVSNEFFGKPVDQRAAETGLPGSKFPPGAGLYNLRGQQGVDVVGVFDPASKQLHVMDHKFNGALSGMTIDDSKSTDPQIKRSVPVGEHPNIPGDLYKDNLRETKAQVQSEKETAGREIPYGEPDPTATESFKGESAAEAGLEKVTELKSVSDFTREHYESRKPVIINGIKHEYREGKGYVTDGFAPNLLNPPGAKLLNLGGNGPSGGYGNPGPFAFTQQVKVGEGESARMADIVLPIPAFNPDKSTWGKEVSSDYPNPPIYRDLSAGSKTEPVPFNREAGAIPGNAAVLNPRYPEDLGGLMNSDFWRQAADERAKMTDLSTASLPPDARLYNIGTQDGMDVSPGKNEVINTNVVGVFDKETNQLKLVDHPFNGRIAGATIEGGVFKISAPSGFYPHIPDYLYSESAAAKMARSESGYLRAMEGKGGRAIDKAGKLVAPLAIGAAVLSYMSREAAAKNYQLPSFEIIDNK